MLGTPKLVQLHREEALEGAAASFGVKPPSTTACFTRRVWPAIPRPRLADHRLVCVVETRGGPPPGQPQDGAPPPVSRQPGLP